MTARAFGAMCGMRGARSPVWGEVCSAPCALPPKPSWLSKYDRAAPQMPLETWSKKPRRVVGSVSAPKAGDRLNIVHLSIHVEEAGRVHHRMAKRGKRLLARCITIGRTGFRE